jgi:hypothetical protein
MTEQAAPQKTSKPQPTPPKDEEPKSLENLFRSFRAEGWSDAEIELGVAGQ